MRFLFWQFNTFVKNRTILVADIPVRITKLSISFNSSLGQNIEELRAQLQDVINAGGFQKLVVFSAGMGFLAGGYEASAVPWPGDGN